MHSLQEILHNAEQQHVAVGHFNVADLVLLKSVFAAARELKVPVLVGASEQRNGNVNIESLRGLEVDNQIIFRGEQDWQIGRIGAFQDTAVRKRLLCGKCP